VVDQPWRGLGVLAGGGLALREPYRNLDARVRFDLSVPEPEAPAGTTVGEVCISGAILQGRARPCDCPAFGTACRPEHPLGAPMVSSEGACAAYYRYRPTGAGSSMHHHSR
jgi:hydrogenase expression/formation protein HypD